MKGAEGFPVRAIPGKGEVISNHLFDAQSGFNLIKYLLGEVFCHLASVPEIKSASASQSLPGF